MAYYESFDSQLSSGNLTIRDSWQPAPATINAIAAMGMQPYAIKTDLRREFILHCQQRDVRNQDWNQLFISYAKQRLMPSQPPANSAVNRTEQKIQPYSPATTMTSSNIMTDDWQPSSTMLEYILAMVCPNKDYIQAQLVSFTSHYHGKSHANWDQQFKKWINQGWNVYQNKNHFKDGDKSFAEEHTDKSWREGL